MAQLLTSDAFGQARTVVRTAHMIRTRLPLSPLGEGKLSECPADVRALALAFLDDVSAPLTARQIERALRDHGVSKSQRAVLGAALARFTILAVTPKERTK